MKRKKITIILFLLLSIISCHIYTPNEIIEKGNRIKDEYQIQLKTLIEYSNNLAKDSCTIYSIYTSPKPSYSSFLYIIMTKKKINLLRVS